MRKLYIFITLISVITFVILTGINAQDEDIQITKLVLKTLQKIGVNTKNMELVELEPEGLINYKDFLTEDLSYQKKYFAVWSTIWHDKLDKFNIKTKSSSTLKGYPVTNLFDKNTSTAWVEGVEGNGVGEWISVTLHVDKNECPSEITWFGMVPGYLKNEKTWEENNRVKSAILVINSPWNEYSVYRLRFTDYKGMQIFNLKYNPIAFDKTVWIIIEDVYKGEKYSDTCISEMVIRGAYSVTSSDPG